MNYLIVRFISLTLGFILGIVLFGPTVNAKKYIITMRSQSAFEKVQIQKTSVSGHVTVMGVKVEEIKSLKHLAMFIVESKGAIEGLESHPDVYSVKEDVIFQGLDPRPPTGAYNTYSTHKYNIYKYKATPDDPSDNNDTGESEETPVQLTWGQKAIHASKAWDHTRGEGIRVLVMDTGVDKDHPEFHGNFEKGQNFMTSGPSPDAPYKYYDDHGHGTHTAGTILGQTVGVAPGAKLLSAKVCNVYGRCSTSGIYSAVNWGITEKVDIISLSLGGPYGGVEEKRVYERAQRSGIVVVAAAGNNGTPYIDYPGRFPTVISVGAVDETLNRASFSQYGPDLSLVAPGVSVWSSYPGMGIFAEVQINLNQKVTNVNHIVAMGSGFSETVIEANLAYIGLGKQSDIEGVDLTGKIALVSRGETSFISKVQNAIAKGAVGVIIHNNVPGLITPLVSTDGSTVAVPVIFIEQTVGESAAKQLETETVVRTFISTYMAPAYVIMDGTSMSCPHVSGVAALVRSANGLLSPIDVRDVILSTATDLSDVNQFGAGLVNAEASVLEAIDKIPSPPGILPLAN